MGFGGQEGTPSGFRFAGSRTFTGAALGGFSSSNKVQSATGQTVDFRPGKTLWVVLQSVAVPSITTEVILACNQGNNAKGWQLTRQASTGTLFLLAGSGAAISLGYTPAVHSFSILCIAWRASDSHILWSANGGPFTDAGALASSAPVDPSCATYIGTGNGVFSSTPLVSARVLAFATWGTQATATDAQGNTFTKANRFVLPAAVTGPAVVDFLASRDYSASGFSTKGSSPVALTVSGAPTITAVAERRIVTTDALYADGKVSIPQTDGNGYAYTIRDTWTRLLARTDALSVAVEAYSTLYAIRGTIASVGLYVNSSYTSTTSMQQAGMPQTFDLQPGAGTGKAVSVWEGEQEYNAGALPALGTFVQALRLPVLLEDGVTSANSAIVAPTRPQERLVMFGNSIVTGFFASNPPQTALVPLIRLDYPTTGTGGVTCHSVGASSVHLLASDSATAAATATVIVTELDGTVSNTLWLELMTNDYGLLGLPAATFVADLTRLLNAIITAAAAAGVAGFQVVLQSAIQRIAPASEGTNAGGSTLPDFRSAEQTLAANYPGLCTYVDGSAGAIVSNANMFSDGIHVVDAGFVQYKAFVKTTLNY